jgi:Outer membrane lipoprotein-sorting protein
MIKIIRSLLLLIFISYPLGAITVEEVLDNFADKLGIPTLQTTFKVQLIAKSGDVREIEARAYQKNIGKAQNNRLFIFDFPPTIRGTGLLLHSYFDGRDNNMWIYLPAVRRVKRISLESSGGGYFMGSDFTYRDLINNDYSKMDYELVSDQVIDGFDYHVVKAWGETSEIRQDNGYSFILSYYRKDNSFMMRREYFDFNDDLLKLYQVESFLELGPYIYPTEISMENVQSGHRSLLVATDVNTDDIPDRFFTTRYLQNN